MLWRNCTSQIELRKIRLVCRPNCNFKGSSGYCARFYHDTKDKHDKTYTVINGTVQEEAGRRHSYHHYQNGGVFYTKKNYGLGLLGMITVLANMAYAGMRAQDIKETEFWRSLAFICGFPGTLFTYFAVVEGSEVVYGVRMPVQKKSENSYDSGALISHEELSRRLHDILVEQKKLTDRIATLESQKENQDGF